MELCFLAVHCPPFKDSLSPPCGKPLHTKNQKHHSFGVLCCCCLRVLLLLGSFLPHWVLIVAVEKEPSDTELAEVRQTEPVP